MEIKKNPKKDLNHNSGLYFAIGLFLVMALIYTALEWKTFYSSENPYLMAQTVDDDLMEPVELYNIELPKPPPPPVAPTIIEIIPDDPEIPETEFASTESDPNTVVAAVTEINYVEVIDDEPIPFIAVEEVPVFPGCENESDKRACFNKMMQKHIIKNFRYPELEQEMNIQGKVNIMFEIQKDGSIGNIRMRGPNKNLENEAARIIDKLPVMKPGKQRGKPVRVPFSIPITFQFQ